MPHDFLQAYFSAKKVVIQTIYSYFLVLPQLVVVVVTLTSAPQEDKAT